MSWLYYLLESNLYLIAFYGLYRLLFRRETYYQLNRAYLLVSTVFAFFIPLLQIGVLKPVPHIQNTGFTIVEPQAATIAPAQLVDPSWSADDYYLLAYGIVTMLLLAVFTLKIYKLIRLSRAQKSETHPDFKLIELPGETDAFSFFNYLFIGGELTLSSTIIRHEMIHIRQRHSLDIIYLELFKIVNWFNPAAYLLQNSMKEVHEFIADSETVDNSQNVSAYADFLVNSAYGIHSNTLTNAFFNKNLLKKRIMMLHQKRSGITARLKFLVLLPVLAGLLSVSTLAFAKNYGWIDLAPGSISKVEKSPVKSAGITSGVSTDDHIPALGKGSIGFIIDPSNYSSETLSTMSSKFNKRGYKMDFDEFKDGAKAMLKISLRRSDSDPNSGVTATFKVDELIKLGHVIFVGADPGKNILHVQSHKFVLLSDRDPAKKADTISKEKTGKMIRKQTDSVIKGKIKNVNARIDSAIKGQIKNAKATDDATKVKAAADQQPTYKLPPPMVIAAGFQTLAKYMQRNVRYWKEYVDQKTPGNVIVEFGVNTDHKVSGVKIKNDAKPGFADEVSRQLKAYTDTINVKPGTYFFLVQFNMFNEKQTRSWLPSNENPNLSDKPGYAGNVELGGFLKD